MLIVVYLKVPELTVVIMHALLGAPSATCIGSLTPRHRHISFSSSATSNTCIRLYRTGTAFIKSTTPVTKNHFVQNCAKVEISKVRLELLVCRWGKTRRFVVRTLAPYYLSDNN